MEERFKPSVTVAAVIERGGRFLVVEEHTSQGLMLNNPAGHLEQGESLWEACAREALEETAQPFTPTALVGVYLSRLQRPQSGEDISYLRFAYCGELGDRIADRAPTNCARVARATGVLCCCAAWTTTWPVSAFP